MHVHGINNNHTKDGCIHLLPPVLRSELPLNLKIILSLLVVPIDFTRGTVVGLYHHRYLDYSLHQIRFQIITLLRHLTPPNTIEALFFVSWEHRIRSPSAFRDTILDD